MLMMFLTIRSGCGKSESLVPGLQTLTSINLKEHQNGESLQNLIVELTKLEHARLTSSTPI